MPSYPLPMPQRLVEGCSLYILLKCLPLPYKQNALHLTSWPLFRSKFQVKFLIKLQLRFYLIYIMRLDNISDYGLKIS